MKYIKSFEQNINNIQSILLEIFDAITSYNIEKFKSLIDKIDIETTYINPKDTNEHERIIHKICESAVSYQIHKNVDNVKQKGLIIVKKKTY